MDLVIEQPQKRKWRVPTPSKVTMPLEEQAKTYRVCRVCERSKTLNLFSACRGCHYGRGFECWQCFNERKEKSGQAAARRQKATIKNKIWAERPGNKLKKLEALRRFYDKNRDNQAYIENRRAKHRAYEKKRKETNPEFRLITSLRTRIKNVLLKRGEKAHNSVELLGCSAAQYRAHIESTWLPGMSWDNYGIYTVKNPDVWHVDHIIPCSSFDMTDPEQQKRAFNWLNTKAMWGRDNIVKSDKIL